jgi:signal transduction histidine kinase
LLIDRSGYREEAYFSVSHALAENDEGVVVGMLAVCSEVTAQVVGERRLKLLSDLATQAGEAHDFNNLLAVVIGSLDLMARRIARLACYETPCRLPTVMPN